MGKNKKCVSSSKGLAEFRNSKPFPLPPPVSVPSGDGLRLSADERVLFEAYSQDCLDSVEGNELISACEFDMDDEFLAEALASGEISIVHGKNEFGGDELMVESQSSKKFKELEAEYLKLTGTPVAAGVGSDLNENICEKSGTLPVGSWEADFIAAEMGKVAGGRAGGSVSGSASVGSDSSKFDGKGPSDCSVQAVENQVGGGINGGQSLDVEMVESQGVKAGFGGLKSGFIPPINVSAGGSRGVFKKKFQGGSKIGDGVARKPMNSGVGDKLSFIPPSGKKFSVDGSEAFPLKEVWGSVLLGQYVGAPLPNFKIAELMRDWGVPANFRFEGGWIIFQFKSDEDRDKVLRGGPYFVYNKPMIVKLVPEFFAFNKKEITTVPLWVRLSGVSKQLWKPKILSGLASYVGVPLFMDPVTSGKQRGAFARVLIEINLAAEIPKEVEFDIVVRGSVISAVCHFEIENEPVFCKLCCEFGHFSASCSKRSGKGPCTSGAHAEQKGSSDGWEKGSKSMSYAQAVNKDGWSNWKGNKKVEVKQGAGAVCNGKKGWVPVSSKKAAVQKVVPEDRALSSGAASGGPLGVAAAGCSVVQGSFGVLASDPKLRSDDESAVLRARKQRLMEEGLLEDCGGETDSLCSEDYGDYAMGGDFVQDLMEDICSPDFVDDEGFEMVRSRSQRKKSKTNEGREVVLGMKAKPKWPGDPCVPSSGGRPGKASKRIP